MKRVASIALLAVFVVAGCMGQDNPKATEKCKASATGDECGSCCSDNGASGHQFVNLGNGPSCKCKGR